MGEKNKKQIGHHARPKRAYDIGPYSNDGQVEGLAYITQTCCSCLMHRSCVQQCYSKRHCPALTSQHAVAWALLDDVARGGT